MPKPLTLSQTTRTADILDAHRAKVMFPPLPGQTGDQSTGDGTAGADGLTLRKAEIILPQIAQGQVRVTLLGGVAAFRGNFVDHQNQFTMAFWEDSRGNSWRALWDWFQFTRNNRRVDYAVDLDVEWYDTTGAAAMPCVLRTVWPVGLTPAPSSEESQPVRHLVQFSLDDPEW